MENDAAGQLDVKAITAWLSEHLKGFNGPATISKYSNGQSNPTFRIKTDNHVYVLRRKPPGTLLKSAHAIDREFRVQKALADSDVPVAKMHLYCNDDNIVGSAFYVMDEVPGRNFGNPALPELPKESRLEIINEMNRVLAAIHNVDIEKTGLSDYGPQGNYYRRQIDRWTKQYRASETEHMPAMEELISWLDTNIPEEDGQRTLVHGDYRIDNMLFSNGGPECVAILDWELSTIGHPFADLAAVIMQWSRPNVNEGRGLLNIDRKAEGLMEDEEFIAAYCDRRGLAGIDKFGFYLAFTFFRMGGILQGVKKRALDGNASNPERALRVGGLVPEFAESGLKAAKTV